MAELNNKWIRRFLDLSEVYASWSKDPSTKVGCTVIKPDNRNQASQGYNGYPNGVPDINMDIREYKYDHTIHAEINAIINAKQNLDGCKVFQTLAPCHNCANALIQAGVTEIYHTQENFESSTRWFVSHQKALRTIMQTDGIRCFGVRKDGTLVHEIEQYLYIEEALHCEQNIG